MLATELAENAHRAGKSWVCFQHTCGFWSCATAHNKFNYIMPVCVIWGYNGLWRHILFLGSVNTSKKTYIHIIYSKTHVILHFFTGHGSLLCALYLCFNWAIWSYDIPRSLAQLVDHWKRGKKVMCLQTRPAHFHSTCCACFPHDCPTLTGPCAFAGRSTSKLAIDPARSPRQGHENIWGPAVIPNRSNKFYLLELVRSQDCPQECLLEKQVWRCPQLCPTA